LNPLLNPSKRKSAIMMMPIQFGNPQISITHHDERRLTTCAQPVSLGGA
jgi:hypothetical protein